MDIHSIDGSKIIKGMTELMRAACVQDTRTLDRMAKEFASVIDITDAEGWTALHYAAANGFEENITVLLVHGASPHTANNEEDTPYNIAVKNGRVEAAKMLKEAEGKTPRIKPEDVPDRVIAAEKRIKELEDELAVMRGALARVLEGQGLSVTNPAQPQPKSGKPTSPPRFPQAGR